MRKLEGKVVGSQMKMGIVAARFNEFIVSKLVSGAEDALVRHGVDTDDVDIAWVPGAFEIPLIAQKMAKSGKYDAVICLGAVIKGSTSHYDYVCAEVSKGVAQAGLNTGVPVDLRCADHRQHRAGHRARRHQGRQQGLRCGMHRHRDGQPYEKYVITSRALPAIYTA